MALRKFPLPTLPRKKGKAGETPALLVNRGPAAYCAGAGAGWVDVAPPSVAGGAASGAGVMGCSAAGGFVLCVVVVSVLLSLQAATPNRANAETDARMSFFIISLLHNHTPGVTGGREDNVERANPFHNIAFRHVTTRIGFHASRRPIKIIVDPRRAV
jgi:hypothetical protein